MTEDVEIKVQVVGGGGNCCVIVEGLDDGCG